MSGIDDGASQEIEAVSSNSTRDSMKYDFVNSILNDVQSQRVCGGKENILDTDKDGALTEVQKREFIEKWILKHGNITTSPQKRFTSPQKQFTSPQKQFISPQKQCSYSPVLRNLQNSSPAKRAAESQILDYQWKRLKRDISAKENCVVPDEWSAILMNLSNDDSDKTCVNSPLLSGNTTPSTLNASLESCRLSERAVRREKCRSAIPGSAKIAETLSVSSSHRGAKTDEIDWSPTKEFRGNSKNSSKLCKNVSPSATFSSRLEIPAETKIQTPIDKQNRLSHRLMRLGAKSSQKKLESGSSLKNINNRSLFDESSKLPETISICSTRPGSDYIDVESSTTNPVEEEMRIESDSDYAASDVIENTQTQKSKAPLSNRSICEIEDASQVIVEQISERDREEVSYDSDETHFSDGDNAIRLQTAVQLSSSPKILQKITEEKSNICISQVPSPLNQNRTTAIFAAPLNHSTDNITKRKKKAKKGTLLAKLQSLVNSRTSSVRIWKHQMSQPEFRRSCTQFVTLKVQNRETVWCRNYITASLVADSHGLLENLFSTSGNCLSSRNGELKLESRTVTLMLVPEITGVVKIRDNSTLNIYPPWEIMDRDRKILNVVNFIVVANPANVAASEMPQKRMIERVVQKFDCPCIRADVIVDSCPEKFCERKPSVMRALFGETELDSPAEQ